MALVPTAACRRPGAGAPLGPEGRGIKVPGWAGGVTGLACRGSRAAGSAAAGWPTGEGTARAG
jgi:hypothetical protein